jgi:hypothetical protein
MGNKCNKCKGTGEVCIYTKEVAKSLTYEERMSDNSYKQCGACRGSGKKSKGVQARIIDILEKTSLKRSIRKELEKSDEFANDVEELKEIIGSEQ